MTCQTCNLEITSTEEKFCSDNNLPPAHARCLRIGGQAENLDLQAQLTLSNIVRLLNDQTAQICVSEMPLDRIYDYLRLLQSEAAKVAGFASFKRRENATSREARVEKIENRRVQKSAEAAEEAKEQARTSSRPISKSPQEPNEPAIAWFMQTWGIQSRKTAISVMHNRDKMIRTFQDTLGVSYEDAIEMCEAQLTKRFGSPRPAPPKENIQ